MFPGVDSSGFWICHSKQIATSNDTNYVKVTHFFGFNTLMPTLYLIFR